MSIISSIGHAFKNIGHTIEKGVTDVAEGAEHVFDDLRHGLESAAPIVEQGLLGAATGLLEGGPAGAAAGFVGGSLLAGLGELATGPVESVDAVSRNPPAGPDYGEPEPHRAA